MEKYSLVSNRINTPFVPLWNPYSPVLKIGNMNFPHCTLRNCASTRIHIIYRGCKFFKSLWFESHQNTSHLIRIFNSTMYVSGYPTSVSLIYTVDIKTALRTRNRWSFKDSFYLKQNGLDGKKNSGRQSSIIISFFPRFVQP